MRVIVAGTRTFNSYEQLLAAIEEFPYQITEVVCGGATGADALGKLWAEKNGIPVKMFVADWKKFGRAAGPKRNMKMGEYADAALICWDGLSSGSKNMASIMETLKKPCKIYYYKAEEKII